MTDHDPLNQWISIVTTQMPHLSQPQATVLALWSFGMVLAKSCALTAVVLILAPLTKVKENTLRQRLREWCYNAKDKRGKKRTEISVESCFPFLLRWILNDWQGKQLALALDATTLSSRFVVLTVSVLYRGCAIPVAWTILNAQQKQAWRREWLRMIRLLRPSIEKKMMVIVLTDRGLYAPWLFRRIRRLGWHPLMRINATGTFRPQVRQSFRPLKEFANQPDSRWCGQGIAFKTKGCQLRCTLLACWEPQMNEAWFLLTDLPPETSDACWYGMRQWIEHGFRTIKRGGWQWHRTRMTDPNRAQRLWLAVSVATLWLLSVGGTCDETVPLSTLLDVSDILSGSRRPRKRTQLRLVSIFRRGWVTIMVALLRHDPLPGGVFIPEPWPEVPKRPHDKSTAD